MDITVHINNQIINNPVMAPIELYVLDHFGKSQYNWQQANSYVLCILNIGKLITILIVNSGTT